MNGVQNFKYLIMYRICIYLKIMIYLPEEFGCSLGASGQKLVGTGQTAVGPGWIAAELGSIVEGTFLDDFFKFQGKKLILHPV